MSLWTSCTSQNQWGTWSKTLTCKPSALPQWTLFWTHGSTFSSARLCSAKPLRRSNASSAASEGLGGSTRVAISTAWMAAGRPLPCQVSHPPSSPVSWGRSAAPHKRCSTLRSWAKAALGAAFCSQAPVPAWLSLTPRQWGLCVARRPQTLHRDKSLRVSSWWMKSGLVAGPALQPRAALCRSPFPQRHWIYQKSVYKKDSRERHQPWGYLPVHWKNWCNR